MATTKKNKEILLAVTVEVKDAVKNINEAKSSIASLIEQQKQLDLSTEQGRIEYEAMAAQIRVLNGEMRVYKREVDNIIKEQVEEEGSLNELKASLSNLTAEYNNLSKAQREGAKGKELQESIKGISDTLKEAEGAIGDYHRSIGEYQNSIIGAVSGGNGFVASLLQTVTASGSAGGALKAIGTQVAAFGKSLWALVTNPVVLTIVAIVGALTLLTKAFERNESNSRELNASLAKLSGAFQQVLKWLEPFAKFLVGENIKYFNQLLDILDAVWTKLIDIANYFGANDLAQGMEEARTELVAMSKAAEQLSYAEDDLVKSQRDLKLIQLTYRKEAEKLRQIRDDETKTIGERIKANEQLGAILKEQLARELAVAQQALAVAQYRLFLEGATAENMDAQADALAAIAEIGERITGQESEQLRNRTSLMKAGADKGLEIAEKQLENRMKINQALIKAEDDFQSDNFAKRQDYARRLFELEQTGEKERLDIQVRFGKLTKENRDAELKALNLALTEFNNAQAKEINAFYLAQKEAIQQLFDQSISDQISDIEAKYTKAIKDLTKLEKPVRLKGQTDEDYNELLNRYEQFVLDKGKIELELERAKNKAILEAQEANLNKRISEIEKAIDREYKGDLAKFTDNEREKNRIELEMIQKQIDAKKAQGLDYNEDLARQRSLQLQQGQLDLNIDLIKANQNAKEKYEARKKYLDLEREIYKDNADELARIGKEQLDLERERSEERIATLMQFRDMSMGIVSSLDDLFSNIEAGQVKRAEERHEKETSDLQAQLERRQISQEEYDTKVKESETSLEKAKADAARKQAIREKAIKTFSIVTDTAAGIAKAVAASPLTFGLPFSAFVAATGALQLATVLTAPIPKAARGKLIQGSSHAAGGTLIEAEGGETIINKRSSSMFLPLLSAINELGGGVPFTQPLSDGGFAVRQAQNNGSLTYADAQNAMMSAAKNITVVATIEDIRKADTYYVDIEDRAKY